VKYASSQIRQLKGGSRLQLF